MKFDVSLLSVVSPQEDVQVFIISDRSPNKHPSAISGGVYLATAVLAKILIIDL